MIDHELVEVAFECLFDSGVVQSSIRIPPASAPLNPHVVGLAARNRRWIVEMGICEPDSREMKGLEVANFEELAARLFGQEEPVDLEIVANLLTLVFMLDDMLDHHDSQFNSDVSATVDACYVIMEMFGPNPPLELPVLPPHLKTAKFIAVLQGFADITRRLIGRFGNDVLEEFRASMRNYMSGVIGECLERQVASLGEIMEFDAFKLVRAGASGILPFLEIGGIFRRFEISAAVRADPAFEQLQTSVALAAAYVNDLFSARKEALANEPVNLVLVLQQLRGLRGGDAITQACKVHDQEVGTYLEARDELLGRYEDPGLREYIQLAEDGLQSNFAWFSSATQRYASVSSTDLQIGDVLAATGSQGR